MSTRALLQQLRDAGVTLAEADGRLRVTAPSGVLTTGMREAIARHRDDLLRLVRMATSPEPLPAAPEPGVDFGLSHPQQRIWFIDQLAGGQAAYVIPAAVYVHGPLDLERLRGAVETVTARHDALRTGFSAEQGEPRQSVRDDVAVDLPIISVEHLPPGQRRDEAERLTSEIASQPFDLSQPPLFRTGIVRLRNDEHLWYLCIHHIVADGTSLRLLLHDVLASYDRAATRDEAAGDETPAVRYGSFVAWQHARTSSGAYAPMQEYWHRRLAGVPPLNLIPDRPRTAERRFAGSAERFVVDPDVTEGLRQLARRQESSLYSVLFTAFQVLMARLAGQRDVAVGTAMANRVRPEFERLVGCLANTVVVRSNIDGDASFVDLLARVHADIRNAWTHQEMPFEQLVGALKQRDAGRNPLFDVFFALNVPIPATTRAGLRLEPVFVRPRAAKFELALFAEDSPEGLKGLLEYQTDLWDAESVSRIARRFALLLAGIVENPAAPVGTLDLFDDGERQQLEQRWDASRQPYSTNAAIVDLVRAQAERTPGAVAIEAGGTTLTYAQLCERAARIAGGLRARGYGSGQLIGLSFDRSADMVAALLGVLASGAAYVPLDTAFPADRLRFITQDSGLDAILTTFAGPSAEMLRAQSCASLPEGAEQLLLEDLVTADGAPVPAVDPESLAYVLYTSGSTGRPKGVEVTHRNVVNFLESMAREPGLSASDVLVAVTTLSFDIAVLELLLPIIVGARVVIASREVALDGARLAELLATSHATAMQATPATWRMLLEAGYQPRAGMKVLCGGEALPARLAADLSAAGAEVWNLYGPTETTVWSAVARVRADRPPTLGGPVANTRLYVLDRNRRPVPTGVPGDIFIGGDGVARGYRGRPELTAQRFVPDPFNRVAGARMYDTGDRGVLGPDGTLQFLGRSDDQLKVRGFRIEPGEIETALGRHMGVRDVAVVGHRRTDDDVRLIAFVRCAADDFSAESFRRFLSDRLPSYMIPSAFVRMDELPSTPNGKVDRAALVARAADVSSVPLPSDAAFVGPRNGLERTIAGVWRDVLGLERVGRHDSFFDLGGHSLLAARVVSRIEASLHVRLPINLFAVQPTVADHAEFVARELAQRNQHAEQVLEWIESLSEQDTQRYLESLQQ